MGNSFEKCFQNCVRLQHDEIRSQTRFIEITGNFNKSIRCRKFFISSQPLEKQKINQLLIFTDASLNMSIPNFNMKLDQNDIQKLQQTLKYQIYNNNLVISQNCFVLNAIEQQIDSQYEEFRQFASMDSQQQSKSKSNQNQSNPSNKINKEKLKNQIQQFALKNKYRAFRFKNPLRKYLISHFIVVILPIFQKITDLNILKQAVQQGLSMSEDLKSVGVSEISFMLGYESSVFQKIILQYILGYSRTRKQYVLKRMSEFIYLTRSNQQINDFFNFLNIYTKTKLEKIQSAQTLDSEKKLTNVRRLGSNSLKKIDNLENKNIFEGSLGNQNQNINLPPNLNNLNNSFSNTSYHTFNNEGINLIGFDRQKVNANSQSNLNISRRSFSNGFGNGLNDFSEIGSRESQSTELKNVKLRSFKSKDSNISDYF